MVNKIMPILKKVRKKMCWLIIYGHGPHGDLPLAKSKKKMTSHNYTLTNIHGLVTPVRPMLQSGPEIRFGQARGRPRAREQRIAAQSRCLTHPRARAARRRCATCSPPR